MHSQLFSPSGGSTLFLARRSRPLAAVFEAGPLADVFLARRLAAALEAKPLGAILEAKPLVAVLEVWTGDSTPAVQVKSKQDLQIKDHTLTAVTISIFCGYKATSVFLAQPEIVTFIMLQIISILKSSSKEREFLY